MVNSMNEKEKSIIELESMTDMQLVALCGKLENDELTTVLKKRGYDYDNYKEIWTSDLYDVWKTVTSYINNSFAEIYGEDADEKAPIEKHYPVASRLSLKDAKELVNILQNAETDKNVSYEYEDNWINGLHSGEEIINVVESMNNTLNVKELRQATGMSQSKLAEYFGIPVRTLQDWEQGKRKPPEYVPKMMKRILQAESSIEI